MPSIELHWTAWHEFYLKIMPRTRSVFTSIESRSHELQMTLNETVDVCHLTISFLHTSTHHFSLCLCKSKYESETFAIIHFFNRLNWSQVGFSATEAKHRTQGQLHFDDSMNLPANDTAPTDVCLTSNRQISRTSTTHSSVSELCDCHLNARKGAHTVN